MITLRLPRALARCTVLSSMALLAASCAWREPLASNASCIERQNYCLAGCQNDYASASLAWSMGALLAPPANSEGERRKVDHTLRKSEREAVAERLACRQACDLKEGSCFAAQPTPILAPVPAPVPAPVLLPVVLPEVKPAPIPDRIALPEVKPEPVPERIALPEVKPPATPVVLPEVKPAPDPAK
jgi:hypothetical protein